MGLCASANAVDASKAGGDVVPKMVTDSQYKLGKTLGNGASCQVYVVQSKANDEKFALKMLPKSTKREHADNEYLFDNERRILAMLDHPNVVKFKQAYFDPQKPAYCIVTHLCQGGELFERVIEGNFSEQDASRLVKQMLMAIQHCHDRKVTHRDLKPENFVYERKGVGQSAEPLKLIDFGVALKKEDDEEINDVAGSPYYVAPEILKPSMVDGGRRTGKIWRSADMWSIGVIAFLLVHGYPPFNGDSQHEIFSRIDKGRYRFAKDIPLSETVKDFIRKLLKRRPEGRLTATEALAHPWIQRAEALPKADLSKHIATALSDFSQTAKLRRVMAKAISGMISDTEKEFLAELFRRFDKDGNGRLDREETAELLAFLKGRVSAKQAAAFFEATDKDGDGGIDEAEFMEGYAERKELTDVEIRDLFRSFDKDKSGTLEKEELKQALSIGDSELKQLMTEVDKDGDGKISLDEFMTVMKAKVAAGPGADIGGDKR